MWLVSWAAIGLFSHRANAVERIHGTNRNYQQGDWITWSATRFVRDLAIGDQYIYFATTGGITRYNFFSDKWDFPWTISNGLASNDIFIVGLDFATGYLWCVHNDGLAYLEPASQLWNNVYYDELPFWSDETINSIGFGDFQVYLVTSQNRLFVSTNTQANFYLSDQPAILNSAKDESEIIQWHGLLAPRQPKLVNLFMTDGYFFDENKRLISDIRFRRYPITCWAFDKWRKVWLGTWGLGAGRGDLNSIRLDLLSHGLWDETVDAIARDRDRFWLGGVPDHDEPSGVTDWNPGDQSALYYEPNQLTGFDNDRITAIAVDGDIVWFGTQDGLTRFDRNRNNWRTLTVVDNLVGNFIHDIVIDKDNIWAATSQGVSRLNKAPWGSDSLRIRHVMYPSLGEITVYDLEKQLNLLWMATEYGIFVYDTEADSGGFYKGVEGPSDQEIFAVSCYGNEVWFGTEAGVAALNVDTKNWLTPPAKMNNTDAGINRILAARDAVWVATNSGVLKYDRAGERWVHYTVMDGLPDDQVYSLCLDGDYIWFGTARGLTRFYWNSPWRMD